MTVTSRPTMLRGEVWLVRLDPVEGGEMRKTRPCAVVSPDEMNRVLYTVIVAPLTSTIRRYPSRVGSTFGSGDGQVALDQMRAVDRTRGLRRLGFLTPDELGRVLAVLQSMFDPA